MSEHKNFGKNVVDPLHLKSPARITLSLDIVKKLPNNLHVLQIIKQTINLCDDIEIKDAEDTRVIYDNTPVANDIVVKMIKLLKKTCKIQKNVHVFIKKNIPLGSGLAGGSSNATAVLKALKHHWNLNKTNAELMTLARRIGQDCPYFVLGGTCYDTEAGLDLKQLPPLPAYHLLLVYPGFTSSTAEAYSLIDYDEINQHQSSIHFVLNYAKKDFDLTKYMHNDFEAVVFKRHPQLREIKEELQGYGVPAMMTGSGSTVFALSPDEKKLKAIYKTIKNKYTWVHLCTTAPTIESIV